MAIRSRKHLEDAALGEENLVDRHFVLALYDPGECEDFLHFETRFPYPFADKLDPHGIWWEDVLQTVPEARAGEHPLDVLREVANPPGRSVFPRRRRDARPRDSPRVGPAAARALGTVRASARRRCRDPCPRDYPRVGPAAPPRPVLGICSPNEPVLGTCMKTPAR